MTLSTLGGIKTAIDDFLRGKATTSATRPSYFVTLAHARIHYGSDDPRFSPATGRVRAMEAAAGCRRELADGTAAGRLYGDAARKISSTGPTTKLNLPPMDFWAKYVSDPQRHPGSYTIEGETSGLWPPFPDAAAQTRRFCVLALVHAAGCRRGYQLAVMARAGLCGPHVLS
jgi:hypothetical protein